MQYSRHHRAQAGGGIPIAVSDGGGPGGGNDSDHGPRRHDPIRQPAFERITGYTSAEAIGQNARLLKSGQHDDAFYQRLWKTIASGEVWSGHFINRRKDGAFYEEEGTISPVRDAAGKIINYVAVKRDVTHVVQLEAQFRQAQKMEAVGQLAGGVAHDFNNLLTVINGHSQLMLGRLKPEDPAHRAFELILKTGERAAGLTRQLLAFSRKQVLEPKALNLNTLVSEMQKILSRLVREDVQIAVNLHANRQEIMADPGQLEQVLMNLVVNASDAMPQGGTLTIETQNVALDETCARSHPESRPGPHVLLAVSDTGCGMDEKTRARIFEPFFTTKELGKGTGLGLSTVYGIVKQSGGSIEVYSEAGKGSTFKIYLPVASAEGDPMSNDKRAVGGEVQDKREERMERLEQEIRALRAEQPEVPTEERRPQKKSKTTEPIRRPRIYTQMLAPGHITATVRGSLYNTILRAMARLSRLELQLSLFAQYRKANTPTAAKKLLNEIGIRRSELEELVYADELFREHQQRRTMLLKNRAARGEKHAKAILNDQEIGDGKGNWRGNLDEALNILYSARTPELVERVRNVRIMKGSGLLFDRACRGADSVFYLYPKRSYRLFRRARVMAGE